MQSSRRLQKRGKFGIVLVFIGCWRKTTFWSSLVLGIWERTGLVSQYQTRKETFLKANQQKTNFVAFIFHFWTNFNVIKKSFKVKILLAKILALNNGKIELDIHLCTLYENIYQNKLGKLDNLMICENIQKFKQKNV